MGRRKNRHSKQSVAQNKDPLNLSPNLTLNCFANASSSHSKLSKAQRSLPQPDQVIPDVGHDEEECPPAYKGRIKTKSRVRKMDEKKEEDDDDDGLFFRCPYEIWELIGDWIWPCSVATFAALCRDTHRVTQQLYFWIRMYRRFQSTALPHHLSSAVVLDPDSGHRGLRGNVIRSLFYCYPPFVSRLTCASKRLMHPCSLERLTCVKVWSIKKAQRFLFYLKFRDGATVVQEPPSLPHLMDADRGCRVMEVLTEGFTPVSHLVLGRKLETALLTHSGTGFRCQKLSLDFIPQHMRSVQCSDLCNLVFHCVLGIHIWDYYHPSYPS